MTEAARGKSVGKLLLRHAEDLARGRGCFRMALVTTTWREGTVHFLSRHGWQDYGSWFVKPLTDEVHRGGQPTADA